MISSFKSRLLLEDRVRWLKDNTPEVDSSHDALATKREPAEIIDHLAAADPHPKKAYTQWALNRYKAGDFRQEDSPRLSTALSNFDKYKGKLDKSDINQYKSLSDLEDATAPHVGSASSHREERALAKEEGSERVHDQDGLKVTKLTSHAAACQYGAGTKWCTASKDNPAMFDSYSKRGPLYVVNTPDDRKYQLHFASQQYMNERDAPEDLHKLTEKYPGLKDVQEFRGEHPAFDTKEGIIDKAVSGKKYGNGVSPVDHDASMKKPALKPDHLAAAYSARSGDSEDSLWDIAKHPSTPSHVLDEISERPHPSQTHVQNTIAGNPNVSSPLFRKLADDPQNRSSLASNRGASGEDLEHLRGKIKPGDHDLHEKLSLNPNLLPSTAEHYFSKHTLPTAENVLHSPTSTPAMHEKAAGHPFLRMSSATSPYAPEHVLRKISEDPEAHEIEKSAALRNLSTRKK